MVNRGVKLKASIAYTRRQFQTIFMCQMSSNSGSPIASTDIEKKVWNLNGLKKESNRQYLRAFKKCAKATEKHQKAIKGYEDFMALEAPSSTDFEKCPNVDEIRAEVDALKLRLESLALLEEGLSKIKSNKDPEFSNIIALVMELNISDSPPLPEERGPKKPKGKPSGPRKPYNVYKSAEGIEIRVGRSAADNDELSINPEYRDGPDWWMHVGGYPGSHVVIRTHDDNFPNKYKETVMDAAALSAVFSKGPQTGKCAVSLVRCRQVSKPGGAKPGTVRLNGDIATVIVDTKLEQKRLARLESTKNAEP